MLKDFSGSKTAPRLQVGEAQVWRLAVDSELVAEAYEKLTADERERAARMRAGGPRDEFVVGRGCLRWLLGAAAGVAEVALEIEAHGKPRLAAGAGVWFNVAHSRGLALIALSRAGDVGVDVEYVDEGIEALEIARGAFHPLDITRISAARPGSERAAEFYRCWTRKEAVAKADGRGLTMALAEFATGADDDGERMVEVPGAGRFFVRGLEVSSTHMGALATKRPGVSARLVELREGYVGSGWVTEDSVT